MKIPRFLSLCNLLADEKNLKLFKEINRKLLDFYSTKKLEFSALNMNLKSSTDTTNPFSSPKMPLRPRQTESNSTQNNLILKNSPLVKSCYNNPVVKSPSNSYTNKGNSKTQALSMIDENTLNKSKSSISIRYSPRISTNNNNSNSAFSNKVKEVKANLFGEKSSAVIPKLYEDNELPDLDSIEEPFQKFNPDDFSLNKMSEDEQLRLALEKSMSEETVRVQSSAGFLTKKSDQLKFLDGNFDIADISGDENENTRFEADNSQDFIDAIQKKSNRTMSVYGTKIKKACENNKRPVQQQQQTKNLTPNKSSEQAPIKSILKKKEPNSEVITVTDDEYEFKGNKKSKEEEEMEQVVLASLRTYNEEIENKSRFEAELSMDIELVSKQQEKESSSKIWISDEKSDSNQTKAVENEANSYRIVGIVNHLGTSSNSGHYISDVYNLKSKKWSSYDDCKVESISEEEVLRKRVRTGYIFFYIHNSMEAAVS